MPCCQPCPCLLPGIVGRPPARSRRGGDAAYFGLSALPFRPLSMTPSGLPTSPPGSPAAELPDGAAAAEWLAASPAALACCDAEGGLRWANAACSDLVGRVLSRGLALAPQLE